MCYNPLIMEHRQVTIFWRYREYQEKFRCMYCTEIVTGFSGDVLIVSESSPPQKPPVCIRCRKCKTEYNFMLPHVPLTGIQIVDIA